MKPIARILFVVVFLASLGVNLSWAQTFTGTFVGTVNDSTGAVLPGAKLTVTNLDTALERTATSDSTGGYVVPLLPAGEYKITVEISGFKRALRERVSLQVNQELRVDFTLSPGEVMEEVLVTEALPLVQTETATVGTVVAQREVLELPLNGRNFLQLNLLVPGAVPGAKGSQLGTQGGSINVHGLRESSNFFWLDGIDNTTMAIGQLVVNPPTYSVQEFKVQSPTYSAEFGRTAGAQINIITRSGKNTFHGDAYEFLRNDVLDAKNFFDPAGKIPKFRRNQFGFDVGGPIVRDRTFFFGGYEALREHRARTFTGVVPLSAMVTGDFSSLNPNPTLCTDPGAICDPSTGSPFAGNVIPSSRIDSIGGTLAAAYPAPNNPDPLRNLVVNPVFVLYDHSVIGKVDHQLTKNDHLFGRYNFQNIHEVQPVNLFVRTTNIPGYGRQQPKTRFQTFGVSDTHTFSPRVIGEFRFGWNRWKLDYLHQDQGDDIAQRLGIQGLSTQPIDLGFPLINMGGAFENLGSADNLPQHGPFDTYHWAGTVSWVVGKHTWKFGGDYRYFVSDFFLDFAARGDFFFTGAFTNHPLADLLLGFPTIALRGVGTTDFLFVSKSVSFFGQDDWRLRPNVTLTLGLRYEHNVPVIEKQDRMANFYFDTQTVVMAGQGGVSRATYDSDTNNFAPRLGLAWDVFGNGKWAMRWGYGIFYEIPVVNTQLGLRLNPPFFDFDIALGDGSTVTIANAFVNLLTLTPGFNTFTKDFADGYVQQWSYNIQHELLPNFILDVGYVGTKGTHLYRSLNMNQPPPGPGDIQSRRPFPQFSDMGTVNSIGSSIYHGLEVRAEKRFAHGLSFLAAYTYSKAIDDSSAQFGNFSDDNAPQNSNNLRGERGLSNFDARQRFILSYIYELPFGRQRRYWADKGGVAGKILEGWQVNGIVTFQSGQPFTPVLAFDNSNTGQLLDRPDIISDPYAPGPGCPRTRTPDCWVNPAAFAAAAPLTFGNAARGSLIGPGVNNIDFSLLKNTWLTENQMLQFRAEFFNIANHPNFDNPNRIALTPSFGKIFTADGIPSRQIQFALRLIF